MNVYVRVETIPETCGHHVIGVFKSRADAWNCPKGSQVLAFPLHEGPVELREFHTFVWWMSESGPVKAWSGPAVFGEHSTTKPCVTWTRQQDGKDHLLIVNGFDLDLVLEALEIERREWELARAA